MNSSTKESVLFVCTHNSARSQMAEGLLRHYYGDRYNVYSAGTGPTIPNPFAIAALQNIGIDASAQTSKHVDDLTHISMDHVVTVCNSARESCPFVPATKRNVHHAFVDPSATDGSDEMKLQAFEKARDLIKDWLDDEFGELTSLPTSRHND